LAQGNVPEYRFLWTLENFQDERYFKVKVSFEIEAVKKQEF
jgi:hypothetical protein